MLEYIEVLNTYLTNDQKFYLYPDNWLSSLLNVNHIATAEEKRLQHIQARIILNYTLNNSIFTCKCNLKNATKNV